MKSTYLVDADKRIKDFHNHGGEFKAFVEETIAQLEDVIKTAQDEISVFKRLRDAIGLTIAIANEKPRLAVTKATAANLESDLENSLERELKIQPSLGDAGHKPPLPKQNN